MTESNPLPVINRLITTHNTEGKAIFSDAVAPVTDPKPVDNGRAMFGLHYWSEQFPVEMNQEQDIKTYQRYMGEAPGLVISTGTVLRTADMTPGLLSPMHRTVSLDYGIVLEGEVELILDSGERRPMRAGDVAVQRGTMHAWRNMSDTKWARMIYILQPSEPLEVAGQRVGEDLEDMKGVRSSS